MKYYITIVSIFLAATNCMAQYYYNDIVSTKNAINNYSLLRKLQVKKVDAVAYNTDNEKLEDFLLSKQTNF